MIESEKGENVCDFVIIIIKTLHWHIHFIVPQNLNAFLWKYFSSVIFLLGYSYHFNSFYSLLSFIKKLKKRLFYKNI